MEYFETKFKIEGDESLISTAADLLTDMAAECGFEAFTGENNELTGYAQVDLYDQEALNNLIEEFPLEGVTITYTTEKAPNENWNKQWEDNGFDPIEIGDKCVIYDAKHTTPEEHTDDKRMSIFIEAQQAFGTGTHETTQMIMEQLTEMNLKDKNVLDCGCGTGILGIVAAKLGAEKVVAYDIDEWSVENTKHNATLNCVGGHIDVLHGNATVLNHVSGVFDVVLANINRNILLNDMSEFCQAMRHGTTLIISGFYKEDMALLIDEAEKHDLYNTKNMFKGEWACMVFTYK